MKLSSLKSKPVIAVTGAAKVGNVDDALADLRLERIEALRVRTGRRQPPRFVSMADVRAIGKDAAIVASADALKSTEDAPTLARLYSLSSLLGSSVVTEAGQVLGTVADVDFDPASRQILDLECDRGRLGTLFGRRYPIMTRDVLGVGEGLVTVSEEARPAKAA